MNTRYVKKFRGGSKAISDINDWIDRTGNIIISITPVVSVEKPTYYVVLYEVVE